MDKRTLLAVAMALIVGLHGFAGAAMADSSATVSRAEAAASSDDSVTRTLTYTFTASSNRSVTANDRVSRDGGNVVFEFVQWTDLTTGDRGSSTSWTLEAGHEYEVAFESTVYASADAANYYADVFADGPYGQVEMQVTEPAFGYIYTKETELVFKSGDSASTTKDVEIPNTGGLMKPTDVTFSGVPTGFTVDYSGLSNEIAAGRSGSVTLQISADSSVAQGTYQFEATVEDNLGNTETFPVEVTVEKPPILGLEGGGSNVDVGNVLVGSQKTLDFIVREQGGYSGISGVTSQITGSDQYGTISFDDLRYLSTDAGGSSTAQVTVSVSEKAGQHSQLEWTVFLQPDHQNGVGKEITFTGRVIYPARFGTLSMSNTSMVFDEPKSEVTTHTKTVTVTVPNTGDKDMNVQDASAQIANRQISASVVDYTETVGGMSTGEVTVEVQADPSTPEGNYSLDVSVAAEKAGQKSISKQVQVDHEVALSVEKTALDYGDVIVTKNLTKSTDVAESLGYEDVSNLSIRQVSGPDQWLTVVERPSGTLAAGDSGPFVVAIQFDTSAELYREYTWQYRITGDGIRPRTINVTATSKPYSFDQIRDPLKEYTGAGDWRSETATGMVETLDSLETRLRGGGKVSQNDLSTAIAAGRATLLFIDSVQNAREVMASEGNEAAQDEVVRAAATYNLLDSYVSNLEDSRLRSSAEESRSAAKQTLDGLIRKQTNYYRSQLESGNVSMIDRAHIKRQLAQLASLQGDEKRAKRLRTESAAAFDEYTALVKKGNRKRQRARTTREEMRDSMLTVAFGQPLLLNPAKWDAFDRKSAAVRSTYAESAAAFERAGADEAAQRVRSERQRAAGRLQTTRYTLYGSTAAYALVFLGVLGYLVRNTYAYVRDAREAVTGDFLVAS